MRFYIKLIFSELTELTMPPKGSVLCFMCRAALRCEAGDLSKYRRHMKINHQVI